jgi:hypothetical protein
MPGQKGVFFYLFREECNGFARKEDIAIFRNKFGNNLSS